MSEAITRITSVTRFTPSGVTSDAVKTGESTRDADGREIVTNFMLKVTNRRPVDDSNSKLTVGDSGRASKQKVTQRI